MTSRYQPAPRGGVAGLALIFCVAIGGAGLAIDLLSDATGPRWLLAQPGARAVLGVIVTLTMLAIAFALRWALGRPVWKTKGGGDAGDPA